MSYCALRRSSKLLNLLANCFLDGGFGGFAQAFGVAPAADADWNDHAAAYVSATGPLVEGYRLVCRDNRSLFAEVAEIRVCAIRHQGVSCGSCSPSMHLRCGA
jgi:hypothetical protein